MRSYTPNQISKEALDYIKTEDIGKVIGQGLASLYKDKPQFPVEYLAKWLKAYQLRKENEGLIKELSDQRQELLKQEKDVSSTHEEASHDEFNIQETANRPWEDLKVLISETTNYKSFIVTEFPELIERHLSLTGVYIGKKQFQQKILTDDEDQENGHLLQDEPMVIRFIGSSESHKFMIGQELALTEGVIPALLQVEQANEENDEENQIEKEKYLYIPDVTQETNLRYFKIPKLGSFIAIPFTINDVLTEDAFLQGLEAKKQYLEAEKERQDLLAQREQEFQERIQGLEEDDQEFKDAKTEYEEFLNELEPIVPVQFLAQPTQYVFCADSLGQDRQLKVEEREKLESVVSDLAAAWEKHNQSVLEAQIMQHIELEAQILDQQDHINILNEQEERGMDEAAATFEALKDDDPMDYEYQIQCAKLEKIVEKLQDPMIQQIILSLSDQKVLRFQTIIKNILYLLGSTREDICQEGSHELHWEKISPSINDEFIQKIASFSHRGSKTTKPPVYAMISKIQEQLDQIDEETVLGYNIGLAFLLQWAKQAVKCRIDDILVRRNKCSRSTQLREQLLDATQADTEQKAIALQETLDGLSPEEQAEFNQQNWEDEWIQEHPIQEIPDLYEEIDLDYELTEEN